MTCPHKLTKPSVRLLVALCELTDNHDFLRRLADEARKMEVKDE